MWKGLGKTQKLGARGSGGAPQPAESTADASQLGGLPTVRLRLCCFNCGVDQSMLSKDGHLNNLSRIIAKAVHEQDLHMVTLCEVGGHKQGLAQSLGKSAEDLVSQVLTRHYKATTCQAYMATWQAAEEPNDATSVTLTLPAGRAGAMNALTGRVMPRAERILQEMYDWYEARVDDEELHVVFRHLQNTLFKNVTVQLPEDVWKHPDVGGASQPVAQGETHPVVSREHVARQVQTVIAWREKCCKTEDCHWTQ